MIHMIVTATTVNEQTNVWLKYFTTIDWDKIVGTFIDKVLSLLFFTGSAALRSIAPLKAINDGHI